MSYMNQDEQLQQRGQPKQELNWMNSGQEILRGVSVQSFSRGADQSAERLCQ